MTSWIDSREHSGLTEHNTATREVLSFSRLIPSCATARLVITKIVFNFETWLPPNFLSCNQSWKYVLWEEN